MALLCHPVTALTVRPARWSGLIWAVPAFSGAEFRLAWIHTVSRRAVSERYAIDADGRLCLREMIFDHEGPNLPSGPEEGTAWRIEEGRAIVTGYLRCADRLNLGVCPFGHCLEYGSWDWDLVAGVGPDRLIRVTLERIPLILIVLAEVRQWRHDTNRS